LINKSLLQMHSERAARRASHRLGALIKDSKKYNPSLTKTLKKLQAASALKQTQSKGINKR